MRRGGIIGSGAFGTVYKVMKENRSRLIFFKILKRFQMENTHSNEKRLSALYTVLAYFCTCWDYLLQKPDEMANELNG